MKKIAVMHSIHYGSLLMTMVILYSSGVWGQTSMDPISPSFWLSQSEDALLPSPETPLLALENDPRLEGSVPGAGAEILSAGKENVPNPDVNPTETLGVEAKVVKEADPRLDVNAPLVNPYVNLPIEIRDATSTNQLMQYTQRIIDATQVEIPAGTRGLSLVETVRDVLQKNLSLRGAKQTPLIVGTQIDVEKAAFDPSLFANVTINRLRSPVDLSNLPFSATGVNPGIIAETSTNRGLNDPAGMRNGIGIRKKSEYGTEVTLSGNANRKTGGIFGSINSGYNTYLSAQVVQPLLRGYGLGPNLAGVRVAYNNRRISEEDLRAITMNVITQAHASYWELVYARLSLAVAHQSLALAADLLRENRIRYRYGDLIAVDVYEAEAGVKSREQVVIQAQNTYENQMDRIRELLNLDRKSPDWEQPLIPLDPPIFYPVSLDPVQSMAIALERNPEIRAAKIQLQNAREQQIVAQDAYKPRLDLFAGLSEAGLGSTIDQSWNELKSGDYESWSVGVQYEVPLYRRREKANIMAANYGFNQTRLNLEDTEQKVIYQHREAIRNLENLSLQVSAARATVLAEKDRLEKQKIGHEQGITTSHDLLQVQEDYARAQVKEIRAIVDYYLALIEVERVRGTLLESLGFEFIPMEEIAR